MLLDQGSRMSEHTIEHDASAEFCNCAVCQGERWDMIIAEQRRKVAEHGYTFTGVFPVAQAEGGTGYCWTYTTGLWSPTGRGYELGITTIDNHTAQEVLASAAERLEELDWPTGKVEGLLSGGQYAGCIREVDPSDQRYPFNMAAQYWGHRDFRACQLVWPDGEHRWPWDDDYNHEGCPQPLLREP